MKEDRLYLNHLLESIARIEEYTASGHSAFVSHTIVQDAVMRNLEIMGEATKQLSSGLRDQHSEVPWRQIAGMRDVLIHDYMGVDPDEVWNVVANDLPRLKQQVSSILNELDSAAS